MSTPVSLAPDPVFKAFDNNGIPLLNGKLFTYVAGSSTPLASYVDSTGTTPNTNPVILNARGEANVWLQTGLTYKLTLQDSFGNQIWSIDQVPGGIAFTATQLGSYLYPQTAAELAAGVTPTNYQWQELDPRRYGAVGDNGTTDNTTALTTWSLVVNASNNPTSTWPAGQIFMSGPIPVITAANFTWFMNSTILCKPNSFVTTAHVVNISGAGAKIYNLSVNGNQANFSAGVAGYLLTITGNNWLVTGAHLYGSCSAGFYCSSQYGLLSDSVISNNAYQALEWEAAAYIQVVNCQFNFNGYGFQLTLATNGFQAFATALRFRCHHITFTNCEALQSGRDGFNTNQGSYAIKYIGCVAWMNGDGGFTIASDNTSAGTPGNAEACYDIEYVDCESYNNWSSGLSAYAPCYNVTVDGGRYYNNHRLAGTQTEASSYFNGLYFSGGSQGIRVRTKTYDDRQLCPITVAASGVITATNWGLTTGGGFQATAAYYPRVALYNASLIFQGWGNISTESLGSVTITSSSFNGVTLSSIAAGWYITQRVQNNGCFFDNGCVGTADIDPTMGGFLQGVFTGLTPFKTFSGSQSTGQNILLTGEPLDYTELLVNPTFDANVANWTFSTPGGGTANLSVGVAPVASASQTVASPGVFTTATQSYVAGCPVQIFTTGAAPGGFIAGQTYYISATGLSTTTVQLSATIGGASIACTGSAACTLLPYNTKSAGGLLLAAGTSVANGDAALITNGLNYIQDSWVETAVWCNAVGYGDAQYTLFWGATSGTQSSTVIHPGGGWKQLKIGAFFGNVTFASPRVTSAIGKTNFFDNVYFRGKTDSYSPLDYSYPTRNLPY